MMSLVAAELEKLNMLTTEKPTKIITNGLHLSLDNLDNASDEHIDVANRDGHCNFLSDCLPLQELPTRAKIPIIGKHI